MTTISTSKVDAALDTVADDESPASVLADLLDRAGGWDWDDGAEHDPSDRIAVLESSGAWWAIYRGTESDDSVRCATETAARAAADKWISEITG